MHRMPELPEVEITRLGLQDAICGQRIIALQLGKPLRWPLGCATERFAGQRIEALRRRGKYLLLQLQDGELIVHLGMSGSLRWLPQAEAGPPGAHDHLLLRTESGELRLRDPRRFGAVIWHPADSAPHPLLARLGPEPLDRGFDGAALQRALHGRRVAIKAALLDQGVVAGIGNIYACEALARAGIDPRLPAGELSRRRCDRLALEIRATLNESLAAGGSTLRDFAHSDGAHGSFQARTRVYGRAGEPCHGCGRPVLQITQGQRSTYFCPHCQRR
jgi:formamidopyrimidine-DNA glycosylase